MKNIKIIFLTLITLTVVISCVKDDVESNSKGDYVVGFKNSSISSITVEPESSSEKSTSMNSSEKSTSMINDPILLV